MEKKLFCKLSMIGVLIIILCPVILLGSQNQGVLFIENQNQRICCSLIEQHRLPLYARLPSGFLIGGSYSDSYFFTAKGIGANYLGDMTGKYLYLVKSDGIPDKSAVRKNGTIVYESDKDIILYSNTRIAQNDLRIGSATFLVPVLLDPQKISLFTNIVSSPHAYDPFIDSLVAMVDTIRIRHSIKTLQSFGTRYYQSANRFAIAETIKSWFNGMGIQDVRLDTFYTSDYDSSGNNTQVNVVATMPGYRYCLHCRRSLRFKYWCLPTFSGC